MMDVDIIVYASLNDFYNQSFDGAYAAVIKDRFDFCAEVVAQKKKLGMKDEDVYFNSGFILFNLNLFREHISFDDIINFIDEHRKILELEIEKQNNQIKLLEAENKKYDRIIDETHSDKK
jgi:lipopolysaccharide biosynthesis glycosyltransferase